MAVGSASASASVGAVTSPSLPLTVTIALYAYVVNGANGAVAQYTIDAGGALSIMTPATVPTGRSGYWVTTTD